MAWPVEFFNVGRHVAWPAAFLMVAGMWPGQLNFNVRRLWPGHMGMCVAWLLMKCSD